ncbi:hypothetical protein KMW28_22750 [Flammeovirga yaeyamensis]|uniref:Lipoprotein n=1 Tax=Flammeovirga yaeyamensis TaxID=367791 RepID=A0AAX1NFW0_9BACT|nr:hypothetical protein [Flammeovirga yaeyamensis]MBB3696818.1 hypothetical protein [Flammeovirga yaeyamensis]NMF33483.1 hypothetical protein [Flammeovirga yaeyamensis]QWG05243.1 hypothetical protein KMW28_22750 [Flammeovirga yaeyamensis]
MKIITSIIYLLPIIIFIACQKNDGQDTPDLDQNLNEVIISLEEYNLAPRDYVALESYKIEDDSLKITYSSSGCSGDSWEVRLIDSGLILESYPPQRSLVFSFKNDEACEAYITKEIAFDISKLKIEDDSVYLNLTNWGVSVLYIDK